MRLTGVERSITTNTGLRLYARLDGQRYGRGIDITGDQLATLKITRHAFHRDWNYAVKPSHAQPRTQNLRFEGKSESDDLESTEDQQWRSFIGTECGWRYWMRGICLCM